MIDVTEAYNRILEHPFASKAEKVPLDHAYGRILAEPLAADRDFPPFDRVTMDGIAIRYNAFRAGIREFNIQAIAAAGSPQLKLEPGNRCMEVMTGAVLPVGADTVIRYEDLETHDGMARIVIEDITSRQNVHARGFDRKQGDVIVPKGSVISAGEVGVAATVGQSQLAVMSLPRTCIISTGDEIVPIDANPEPHQIRTSNVSTIRSVLEARGIKATTLHLPDDYEQTRSAIDEVLNTYDLVILSGGVSKGKFDYVPKALGECGVEKIFHKVRQRPGKPFWFGRSDVASQPVIFGLPGNPVSALACTTRYILPWLDVSLGRRSRKVDYSMLGEDISFKPDLTYFVQSSLETASDGSLRAIPLKGNGSGDLASLTGASGFIELPRGSDIYSRGDVFRWWGW